MRHHRVGTGGRWVGILAVLLLCRFPSVYAVGAQPGLTAVELMRGMALLAGLAAIFLLLATEFFWRTAPEGGTYRLSLFVGLFLLPTVVLLGATTLLFEDTKTVASCSSCHVMHPFVRDLENPQSATLAADHFKNGWIAESHCFTCHHTYGVHGTLAGKRDGFRHWLLYVTGTWQEPIQFSGSFPNSSCLGCHDGTSGFKGVRSHHALDQALREDRVACYTCHGPAHPGPLERASSAKTL